MRIHLEHILLVDPSDIHALAKEMAVSPSTLVNVSLLMTCMILAGSLLQVMDLFLWHDDVGPDSWEIGCSELSFIDVNAKRN